MSRLSLGKQEVDVDGNRQIETVAQQFQDATFGWGSKQVEVVAPQQVSSLKSKQGFDRRRESEKERRMASEDEKRRSIWDLGQSGWSVLGAQGNNLRFNSQKKIRNQLKLLDSAPIH